MYIFAVLIMVVGSFLVAHALFDASPRSPDTGGTRRGRALGKLLESMFGQRGAEAILGLVVIGGALTVGFVSVRGLSGKVKFFTLGPLLAIVLVFLGGGLALRQAGRNETAWQRQTAETLRSLLPSKVPDGAPLPEIREKVVIWDYTQKGPSKAQNLLPRERQGKASDGKVTFVLILDATEKEEKPYTDGTPARSRTLTVAVVQWPEKKVQGVYAVEGGPPPLFVTRPAADKGKPVIGDTDGALQRWITETIPRERTRALDLAALQGTWKANKEPVDPFSGGYHPVLGIKGTKVEWQGQPGLLLLDSHENPRKMTLSLNNGKSLRGIYTIEGGTLTLCFGPPGTFEAPTEFKSGPRATLFVFKREP